MTQRLRPLLAAVLGLATATTAFAAPRESERRHHRQVVGQRQAVVVVSRAPVTYRGLTVTRPLEVRPVPDDQDIYRDGPVRYNDIQDFSPAPYTTSGVQFPYGLDGIGGYGSDLDFGAGNDSALYSRGAGSQP